MKMREEKKSYLRITSINWPILYIFPKIQYIKDCIIYFAHNIIWEITTEILIVKTIYTHGPHFGAINIRLFVLAFGKSPFRDSHTERSIFVFLFRCEIEYPHIFCKSQYFFITDNKIHMFFLFCLIIYPIYGPFSWCYIGKISHF